MTSPLDGNGVLHMNEPVWVWLYDYGPATHPEGWKHDRSGVKAYPQAHTYAFRTEAEALAHPAQMGWAENHPYVLQKTHLNRSPAPSQTAVEPVADEDRMLKISKVIADLTEIRERFGDTCVYIRRGGLSWGAVALNYRDDDKEHGVLDLQAKHDRDMLARVQQNQRLIDDNRELRERIHNNETTLTAQAAALVAAERDRDEALDDVRALTTDRDKFRAIAQDKLADTRLLGAGPRGDGFGFDMMGGPIPYITEYLFQFIGAREEKGPSNYAEIEVNHNEFGAMTLTLQRHSGKTPHQLRAEAEARAEAAESELATLKGRIAELEAGLEQIEGLDAVEAALDPEWAGRTARAVLRRLTHQEKNNGR